MKKKKVNLFIKVSVKIFINCTQKILKRRSLIKNLNLIILLWIFVYKDDKMNYQLRIVVYKKKSIYDDAIITLQSYCNYKEVYKNKQIQCESIAKNCESVPQSKFQIISLRKKGFNAYLVSVYMNNMSRSSFYRQSAIKKIVNFLKANSMSQNFNNTAILIKLSTPSSQFIDYNWLACIFYLYSILFFYWG